MPEQTITVGKYLLRRLKEIGVDTIFGVPGDYNMPFLDLIEDDKELNWGNNANELNASYAADGYARIKGVGALVTTFGVGELSAANGTAGSFSEMVSVVHIVGTPNTKSQAAGALLHHTLGNGNYRVFQEMFAMITVANTHLNLTSPLTTLQEIDRVLRECVLRRRPVYIGLPIDVVNHEVEVSEIQPLKIEPPKNPEKSQQAALKFVLAEIEKAKHPIIMVDACALRNNAQKDVRRLMERTGFPTYVAPMGKGAVDETAPAFRGCYAGSVSLQQIAEEVKKADLILEVGSLQSDFNTGGFSYNLDQDKIIAFHTYGTMVYHATFEKVGMNEFLPLLIDHLPKNPRTFDLGPKPSVRPIESGAEITHNYFWNKVTDYMDPGAIIVAETGTAEFGVFNMHAPKDSTFITQVLWGSIGYSVGSAMGAAIADRNRRVYLFVGDGSFQMTAQEVSVMLHKGLTPVIFLLNNDGYLIEKLIHGRHRDYNNFQMWKYADTLDYMGGHLEHNTKRPEAAKIGFTGKVSTRTDFEKAMAEISKQKSKIHFLEVIMPRFDAPRELLLQVETSENR